MSKTKQLNENSSDISEQKKNEIKRAATIMHAVEMASAFQLYSYRIISHEEFFTSVNELVHTFQKNLANASSVKADQNGQTYIP